MYKDKNTKLKTNGNEDLDRLLSILENNGVLSGKFTIKVENIIIWILTNYKNNINDIKEEIINLEKEMNWLNIFNEKFIKNVIMLLYNGLEKQIILEKQKNYNL